MHCQWKKFLKIGLLSDPRRKHPGHLSTMRTTRKMRDRKKDENDDMDGGNKRPAYHSLDI